MIHLVFFINNKSVTTKVNMPDFLAVHNTYTTVEIGLFANNHLIDKISIEHKLASKELMVTIAHLLARHTLSLTDLTFIAAHQGPGPFTTVRVVISSVNGLAFATKLPLVGVNGLEVLIVDESVKQPNTFIVGLLNAFGNDLYYGIAKNGQMLNIGYKSALLLLQEIAITYPEQSIVFVGNGAALHQTAIHEIFKEEISALRTNIMFPLPEYCTLEQLAHHAYIQWKNGLCEQQLQPVYLKPYLIHTANR